MIFTQEWVAAHVFGVNEFERLVPMMPVAPIIYQHQGISLSIGDDKLIVSLERPNRDSLIQAERICGSILETLSSTPVLGIGINFGFAEEAPSDDLLGLFNLRDNQRILAHGWTAGPQRLMRQIRRDDTTLNLVLTLDGNVIVIDANFHHDTPNSSADDARNFLVGHSRQKLDLLLELLAEVYGLRPRPED